MAVSPEKTTSTVGRIVPLGILGLAFVNLALGFVPQFAVSGTGTNFFEPGGSAVSVSLLFAAGVLAGIGMLPSQRSVPTVAFALSLAGVVTLLFQALVFGSADAVIGGGTFAVLVLGVVQTALALAAVVGTASEIEPEAAPVEQQPVVDEPAEVSGFAEPENTSYGLPGYGTPGNGGQGSVGVHGADRDNYDSGYRDLTSGAPTQIGSAAQGFGSPLTSVGPSRSLGNAAATTGYDSPYGRTTDVQHEPTAARPDSKWAAD